MPQMHRPGHDSARRADDRFNEAEARMPRMLRSIEHLVGEVVAASMRPRHECLGCAPDIADALEILLHASMRPRHECLGCGIPQGYSHLNANVPQ